MTTVESAAQPRATLEVLRTGPLALIEDLGRPGLADMGVSRSGAADRRSHELANRLVWGEVCGVGHHVRSVKVGDKLLFRDEDQFEVDPADWEAIERDDVLTIEGLRSALLEGRRVTVVDTRSGRTLSTETCAHRVAFTECSA